MKLSNNFAAGLKVVHLVFTALWVGGAISLLPLALSFDPTNAEEARATYLNMRSIAWNVIGWGGIGSFVTGAGLGLLTPWGLFRHRWVIAKLALTVYGVFFGMFFVERHMLLGLAALETTANSLTGGAADNFAQHHSTFLYGLSAQLLVFVAVISVAVFKPRFTFSGNQWQLLATRRGSKTT